MNKTTIGVLLIAGSISVGAMLQIRSLRVESNRRIDALAVAVAALGERPAGVVRVVERTQLPAPIAVTEEHKPPSGPPAAESRAEQEERSRHAQLTISTRLRSTFETQAVDRDWSERTQKAIVSVINATDSRSYVKSVECRASLCRIHSVFPNKEAHNAFMQEVSGGPNRLNDGEGVVTPSPALQSDGSVDAVSYWVRTGHMALALPPGTDRVVSAGSTKE